MSRTNTNIQFQRSTNTFSELVESQFSPELSFGEPFFIDNTQHDSSGYLTEPVNAYLALGRKPDSDNDNVTLGKSPVIKALTLDKANSLVFYNSTNGSITDEAGNELPVNRITAQPFLTTDIDSSNSTKYHILCQPDNDTTVYKFTLDDFGIFVNGRGIMKGAAWNDYAEYRKIEGEALPGQVVCDTGLGTVKLSENRLQACAHVVSDTYGHIIGEKENSIPIAVAGRVLVNIDSNIGNIQLGDCVCAGTNGFATKMTSQEITSCPDKILGVVCEVLSDSPEKVWINIK